MEIVRAFDYLEIQHHNVQDQKDYNRWLLKLSQQTGIPLIAGTDTHSSSIIKAQARDVLLEYKEQKYNEDGWDMTWKNYDELIDAYEKQDALPRGVYMDAIENTNVMADLVEDWSLDKRPKYPVLYGSPEADEEKLHEVTWKMLDEKIESGVIPKEQEEEFRRDITEEFDAFHQTNMGGFMLSMHEIINWCRDTGKPIGPSRGSVSGSRVAYVTGITDLNPVQWHTNFSRFCNSERVSLADVDEDCIESDRPAIFEYIISKFGADKCARVAAYGTIADLSFIDDCGGGLGIMWQREHFPEKFKENGRMDKVKYKFDHKNPYNPLKLQAIKKEYKTDQDTTRKKYPDLFYYENAMVGTRVSQSVHPAGMVICCEPLEENWGVFNKDGERCLLIDMNEASTVNLVKYDLLILKTVQVISDTYKLLGLPYPRMNEIDFCDKDVWDDICNDTSGVFQFESDFASDSIK
jgi:DNA polymerase-3 subunit alpha